jgi:integrase/recombinase XerD
MTTAEAIEEFLTYLLAEKGDSALTIAAYETDLASFRDFVRNKDAKDLTVSDLSTFIVTLSQSHLKEASVIRKAMAVRGLYRYLAGEKVLDVQLNDLLTPKKGHHLPDVLTEEEITRLFATVDSKDAKGKLNIALLEVAYGSGLRVSELVLLRKDAVNYRQGYMKITGKGKKERIVPLGQEANGVLGTYVDEVRSKIRGNSPLLFLHPSGKKVSRQYFFLLVKKATKEAEITKHVSPHTLRHSFATQLLRNGAELRQVQELLGHADIETTQIYTHLSLTDEIAAYKAGMKR